MLSVSAEVQNENVGKSNKGRSCCNKIVTQLVYSLQATYLLLVERSGGEKGMTSLELLLYNSILSLPVLVLLIFVTGEVYVAVPAIFTTASSHGSYFLFNLVVSLFIGVLLNYSLFLCTLVNSALTTTVIGALKGVVATVSRSTFWTL